MTQPKLPLYMGFLLVGLIGAFAVACHKPSQVTTSYSAKPRLDGAFLWRGFEHRWTYNHRLNRMGDFLRQEECIPGGRETLSSVSCNGIMFHTGASGTGRDELNFTSHYTETASARAEYHAARAQLTFRGPEEQELRGEQTIEVPVEADGQFVALLNGYDLYTVGGGKAKKVKRFRVWVSDQPIYNPDTESVTFDVGAVLDLNCDSAECKAQRDLVSYQLDVDVLLIRGEDSHSRSRLFEANYRWNKKEELKRTDIPLNQKRQSIVGLAGAYDVGLVGFQELDFDLAKKGRYKDHWFVAWENTISEVDYDQAQGRITFNLTLFFKEWNALTKEKALSLARAGEATLRADVVLVQLHDGRVQHKTKSGAFVWPGKNRSPDDPAAEWRKFLQFEFYETAGKVP